MTKEFRFSFQPIDLNDKENGSEQVQSVEDGGSFLDNFIDPYVSEEHFAAAMKEIDELDTVVEEAVAALDKAACQRAGVNDVNQLKSLGLLPSDEEVRKAIRAELAKHSFPALDLVKQVMEERRKKSSSQSTNS